MAKGASKGGKTGRRLLEAAGASTDTGVDEVVKLKVMQLLAALSSSATGSIMDAATMRQVSCCNQSGHHECEL
jgi:hypothetical protein